MYEVAKPKMLVVTLQQAAKPKLNKKHTVFKRGHPPSFENLNVFFSVR